MRYHVAPIFCRPWQLNGLSQRLIESHYENNYGGALNRLNAITEELGSLDVMCDGKLIFGAGIGYPLVAPSAVRSTMPPRG